MTDSIRPPEETGGIWIAIVEGWHIWAESREHAERIIDACNMTKSIGYNRTKAEMRCAIGLVAYGGYWDGCLWRPRSR